MSYLNSLLGSIGTGQSLATPIPAPRPASANSAKPGAELTKLATRPALNGSTIPSNGTKRKAEEELQRSPNSTIEPRVRPALSSNIKPVSRPPMLIAKANSSTKSTTIATVNTSQAGTSTAVAQTATPKAPAKGSYADIMARAKAAREQKGPNQVGMIKHQVTSKEKIPKVSAQRQKDDKNKVKNGKILPGRPIGDKRRSMSPSKHRVEPKQTKPTRPPLAAPKSSYKGTLGKEPLNSRSGPEKGKRARRDEYLGTDDEDEGDDLEEGDDDGYASEASSDMEAGAFDIDEEERLTLLKAKEDDAKELALESRLKREKEERRKKLQALADKRR